MMTNWLKPMSGWVAAEAPRGHNVDEFASDDDVAAALDATPEARPCLLAVQHPHLTPEARRRGLTLEQALPAARNRLRELCESRYRWTENVLVPYRVSGEDGTAIGILCLVDPSALDTDGHERVRHSEEIYPELVTERATVLAGLRCATSAAMLVPISAPGSLTELITEVTTGLGAPALGFTDAAGRRHELWLVPPGAEQDRLVTLCSSSSLLVADGNHRIAAATAAGLGGMLALITDGPDLHIGAIHRVIKGTGITTEEARRRCAEHGLTVHPLDQAAPPERADRLVFAGRHGSFAIAVPEPVEEDRPGWAYGYAEQVVLHDALGLDPAGEHVRPEPGSTLPSGWIPDGDDAVVLLPAVAYADVRRVHSMHRRMPRKSTYFTPKPRSGLYLARL